MRQHWRLRCGAIPQLRVRLADEAHCLSKVKYENRFGPTAMFILLIHRSVDSSVEEQHVQGWSALGRREWVSCRQQMYHLRGPLLKLPEQLPHGLEHFGLPRLVDLVPQTPAKSLITSISFGTHRTEKLLALFDTFEST